MEYQIKDIKGYEGLYEVDTNGNVYSLNYNKTGQRGMLSESIGGNRYPTVGLCKDGKVKRFYIHRLVAEAFIDNPNNLPIINHIDENRKNNNVENLEFCTYTYNNLYSGVHLKAAKAHSKAVLQFTKQGEFVKEYPSAREASKQTGINYQSISLCCNGKRNTAGNFIWQMKQMNNEN